MQVCLGLGHPWEAKLSACDAPAPPPNVGAPMPSQAPRTPGASFPMPTRRAIHSILCLHVAGSMRTFVPHGRRPCELVFRMAGVRANFFSAWPGPKKFPLPPPWSACHLGPLSYETSTLPIMRRNPATVVAGTHPAFEQLHSPNINWNKPPPHI